MEPGHFAVAAGGEIKLWPVAGANELGGHKQNLLAQGLESGVLKLGRQTDALEPDEIIGEQEQVEVGFIGEEVTCRDVIKGVVALELANDQFDTARSL
jgi:hypothetical protein